MATTQISIRCLYCSCMSGPFERLSHEELALVDRHRTEISYKKGETMCKQGAFISNMMFIRKGMAKIYLEGDQRPIILSIAREGSFIGLPSLFDEGVYHYSVEALADTEVCLVDVEVFRRLLRTNAEFASAVLQMVNEKLINSYHRMHCVINRQINGRFAEMLLNLKNHIYQSNPFDLTLSRKDMADMIYSSPESISRLIKEFKDDGLIQFEGRQMHLINEEKLKQVSRVG